MQRSSDGERPRQRDTSQRERATGPEGRERTEGEARGMPPTSSSALTEANENYIARWLQSCHRGHLKSDLIDLLSHF